jgi:spore germination cell wall hydrolase CwlJ-like protein
MRRRDIINELKIALMVTGIGMGIFASMLLFGMRAKAATVRDGVNTPIFTELVTMDRAEREDMRNAEPVLADEDGAEDVAVGYSASDLDLLAALVWSEAGDQPIPEGLCYVCDVVLNRVDSPAWPNTIREVIYQPGQFSVVSNGALDRAYGNAPQVAYDAVLSQLQSRYNYDIIYFSMGYNANGTIAFTHGTHYYSV